MNTKCNGQAHMREAGILTKEGRPRGEQASGSSPGTQQDRRDSITVPDSLWEQEE